MSFINCQFDFHIPTPDAGEKSKLQNMVTKAFFVARSSSLALTSSLLISETSTSPLASAENWG